MKTMTSSKSFFSVLVAAVVAGAVAGVLISSAATFAIMRQLTDRLDQLASTLQSLHATSTRVTTAGYLPLSPDANVLNVGFSNRLSPVVVLVKSLPPIKNSHDRVVGPEREFASAVALTSDGWLVTTAAAFSGVPVADASVEWNGQTFPITQAIRDTATDAVYLKIDAMDLPVAAFVRPDQILSGVRVWMEPRPKRLYLESVIDTRLGSGEALSSEKAARRFLVTGSGEANALGASVWDERGRLVGIVDGTGSGGVRVLPASDLSGALDQFFSGVEIRHAVLGVRTSDLASIVFDQKRNFPLLGNWVRAGKRGELAVDPKGPAAMLIKDGDVIESLEHDILDGTADLGERLLDYHPGSQVTLYGLRNGQTFDATVTLGSMKTSEIMK